ncbi:conserved unknown protein [Ectocarpus siliculosus]|uniref:Transmembrane protein 267 n=1 Tax=Ectocarpus siliculosus TaxID=2880 RepID=D7FYK9_ECTSI|nr:conserved unknown protein [Ectocarpus siliculosus]|eukprot:CBJ32551.1 conserved unknown protein [Ectocarpus siliculosus]
MDSMPKDLTSRSRDFDIESAEPSSPTTTVSGQPALPVAPRGKRGAGEGCTARRPSAAAALEVLFAACVGSALDLDHFLAAGSVRLSRATALAGRPWGHCVAALIVAAFAVAALTRNARAAVCVFSAGATHQLRDSTRRGLWLYPPRGPKTPPGIRGIDEGCHVVVVDAAAMLRVFALGGPGTRMETEAPELLFHCSSSAVW